MEKVYPNVSTKVSKLGENIACVNLPPENTCRVNVPCKKKCYARKGNFCFSSVKNGIMKNYEAYRNNPVGYFNVINSTLQMIPYKFFRWHSSGDIPDEQYLNMMCKLARKNRQTKFLCFTKQYEIVNHYLDTHAKPSNLTIALSNWGDWKCDNPHNLPVSYVRLDDKTEIPEGAIECSGYCGECVNTENSCWNLKRGGSVWFKLH